MMLLRVQLLSSGDSFPLSTTGELHQTSKCILGEVPMTWHDRPSDRPERLGAHVSSQC